MNVSLRQALTLLALATSPALLPTSAFAQPTQPATTRAAPTTQPATTTASTHPTTTTAPTTTPSTAPTSRPTPTSLPSLPTTLPETATTSAAAVPSPEAQAEATARVRVTYADAYKDPSPKSRRALTVLTLHRAQTAFDPPDIRHALLTFARDTAADAGDAATAMAAVTELARQFNVEARPMRFETLQRAAAKATSDADYAALTSAALSLVNDALNGAANAEDVAAAARLGMAATAWASASHDGSLVIKSRAWNADIQAAAAEAARLQPAFETLKQSPQDPAANTAIGRFRCLYQSDWPRGLTNLTKGSDPTLAALARLELTQPKKDSDQLKLAEGWWDQAQRETGPSKNKLQYHAVLWYARLYPKLSTARRAQADKRLTEAGYSPADLEDLRGQ